MFFRKNGHEIVHLMQIFDFLNVYNIVLYTFEVYNIFIKVIREQMLDIEGVRREQKKICVLSAQYEGS